MPTSVTTYSMLISCPADVLEFIQKIEEAVDGFNHGFGKQNNVQINAMRWSKNSYSQLKRGMAGQDVINDQIVDSSDMMVGVFWTRFGTPTEKYGSGTEEEINRMLDAGKIVMLFFLDKPISPSRIDIEQLSKIKEFKEKISKEKYGLYSSVENEDSLKNALREQLEVCFTDILNRKSISDEQSWRRPTRQTVLWVDDRPENNVPGRKFLEGRGIEVITALSTEQALMWLEKHEVSVIISDMGRKEGQREGYVLLDLLRKKGNQTPYIIAIVKIKLYSRRT